MSRPALNEYATTLSLLQEENFPHSFHNAAPPRLVYARTSNVKNESSSPLLLPRRRKMRGRLRYVSRMISRYTTTLQKSTNHLIHLFFYYATYNNCTTEYYRYRYRATTKNSLLTYPFFTPRQINIGENSIRSSQHYRVSFTIVATYISALSRLLTKGRKIYITL